jgi:hypothetical protein
MRGCDDGVQHPSSAQQWSIFFVNASAFQNVREVETMSVLLRP